MDTGTTTVVEVETVLNFVTRQDEPVAPVRATLRYTTDDQFAVHLTLHPTGVDPINWLFARDLLADGLRRPTGDGDVHVRRRFSPRGSVFITLSSPEGCVTFEANRSIITQFLRRTFQTVPRGHEKVDVESWIPRLLAGR